MFELVINVPEQYPLQPPAVRYRTKIFHPNVHFKVREGWGGKPVWLCACACMCVCVRGCRVWGWV